MNRSVPIRPQRSLQQRNRLRPLPARDQHLRLHFQRGTQREWQVWFGIERALFQQLLRLTLRLLGIRRRLVVLTLIQRGPRHPRSRFQIFRRDPLLVAIRIQRRLSAGKIVLHQGDAHLVDNPRPRRGREQNRNQQNPQAHHSHVSMMNRLLKGRKSRELFRLTDEP